MAEIVTLMICAFVCQFLITIFRCPKCKTIKSCFNQKSLNKVTDAARDKRQCEICTHTWERPYIGSDTGGGGGDGG